MDFRIESGFVDGVNFLEFDVTNAGEAANPIGLRVENLSAFATAVAPVQIISISTRDNPPISATFTWNSRSDTSYFVEFSTDLKNWRELDDGFMSQGDTTTYTDTFAASTGGRVYYRVGRAE